MRINENNYVDKAEKRLVWKQISAWFNIEMA